jgi:hypothetical protein
MINKQLKVKCMKLLRMFSLAAVALLLAQCYPQGPEYADQYDLVYSNYDPQYDFEIKHTYAIPDKILKIDEQLITGGEPNFVKDTYALPMLNQINSEMSAYGWTKVATSDNPDVVLAPVAYELTTYTYWGYGGYWDWWYGGWYGWWYPYPVVTSYSSGSLIVTMLDPNDRSTDDKARATWNFVINGLLEGNTVDFNARFTKGISQAFSQSPYIKK